MSGRLRDFLVELASSTALMTQFAADPAGVAERAGLTADEQHALLARDSDRLRRALGASAADHMTQISDMAQPLRRSRRPRPKPPGAKKRPTPKRRPAPKKRATPKRRTTSKRRTGTKKR